MIEVLPRKKALGSGPNYRLISVHNTRKRAWPQFHAGRLRLQVIPNRKQETFEPVVLENVLKIAAQVKSTTDRDFYEIAKVQANFVKEYKPVLTG